MVASIINLIGAPGLIVIVVALTFFLGGKRFPEIARSIRRSTGEFKRGRNEGLTRGDSSNHTDSNQKPSSQA